MKNCKNCKHYTALTEPREAIPEGHVHGFCFKDYHGNHGSAYPVYIPEGGCKAFVKRAGVVEDQNVVGQMNITDFPEVLP